MKRLGKGLIGVKKNSFILPRQVSVERGLDIEESIRDCARASGCPHRSGLISPLSLPLYTLPQQLQRNPFPSSITRERGECRDGFRGGARRARRPLGTCTRLRQLCTSPQCASTEATPPAASIIIMAGRKRRRCRRLRPLSLRGAARRRLRILVLDDGDGRVQAARCPSP